MTREEIDEQVKKFLVQEFEIDSEKITQNARLREDIGLDSLDFVDIVVIVEEQFGFKIVPEEIINIQLYGQFCDYVYSKVNKD